MEKHAKWNRFEKCVYCSLSESEQRELMEADCRYRNCGE